MPIVCRAKMPTAYHSPRLCPFLEMGESSNFSYPGCNEIRAEHPNLDNAEEDADRRNQHGCVGKCLQQKLTSAQLLSVFNAVAADMTKYPNYGIPNAGTLKLAATAEYCVDLSGGDTSNETPVQVWKCSPVPSPDSTPQLPAPTPTLTLMQVWKCNGLIKPAQEMLSPLLAL